MGEGEKLLDSGGTWVVREREMLLVSGWTG